MLLSVVASAVAVALVVTVMRPVVGAGAAERGALLLLAWPASVFLVLPYADALLLLAAAGLFALAARGRFATAGAVGALGALARSTGAFLVVPLALFVRARRGRWDGHAAVALLVGAGTVAYATYLAVRFGQPLAFAAAESAGWHRVALPPPLPVAYTAGRVLLGWLLVADGRPDLVFTDILDLAAVALVAYAAWTWRHRVPAAFLAWPAVGLLWPLLTGTTSVARYVLVLFPAFAFVAADLSARAHRVLLVGGLAMLGVASYTFGAGGWIG
jgi:hypothetical protein